MRHIDNYRLNGAVCLAQEAGGTASPPHCHRTRALPAPMASCCAALPFTTSPWASHSLPTLTALLSSQPPRSPKLARRAQTFNGSFLGTTLQLTEMLLLLLPYFPFINLCFLSGFTGNNPPCYSCLICSCCKNPINSLPSSKFLMHLLQQ